MCCLFCLHDSLLCWLHIITAASAVGGAGGWFVFVRGHGSQHVWVGLDGQKTQPPVVHGQSRPPPLTSLHHQLMHVNTDGQHPIVGRGSVHRVGFVSVVGHQISQHSSLI